jgi:uncharacterized protein (DUF2141 family)
MKKCLDFLQQNLFWIVLSFMHKGIPVLVAVFLSMSSLAQTGKVILQIENIQTKKGGEVAAAAFESKNFLKTGKELRSTSKEVSSGKMVFVFENLSPGEYAFVAYQDIDRNKKMKTNFIGYPKEPWGISNNPRILFGPPSFNESKVKVNVNQTTTVSIRLN